MLNNNNNKMTDKISSIIVYTEKKTAALECHLEIHIGLRVSRFA